MVDINYEQLEKDAEPGQFSIYDMQAIVPDLVKLRSGDVYVELGVDRGRSLSVADMVTAEGVKINGIDIEAPNSLFMFLEKAKHIISFYQNATEAVAKLWKLPIDILFIDANHDYEYVKKDIEMWLPFMRHNGSIFFHDYDKTSPGVMKAVDEFVYKKEASFQRFDERSSMAKVRLWS